MASTLNGTGVTFSDGSTLESPSTLGAVGSCIYAVYAATGTGTLNTNLYLTPGTTIAGSSLRYNYSAGFSSGPSASFWNYGRDSNPSYAGGGTALSGTWRVLQNARWFYNGNYGCGYFAQWWPLLLVRVS